MNRFEFRLSVMLAAFRAACNMLRVVYIKTRTMNPGDSLELVIKLTDED